MMDTTRALSAKRVALFAAVVGATCLAMTLVLSPTPAQAKSFKASAPTITYNPNSGAVPRYTQNGKINLEWSKVKGAKKYEVYASTKKGSGYKKIATVKKTKLAKKSSGYKWYKVRAVKGKEKSKWSKAYHVFGATGSAKWYGLNQYESTSWFGYKTTNTETIFQINVDNRSAAPMYFVGGYGNCTIYKVSKSKKKVLDKYSASACQYGTWNNIRSYQYSVNKANAKQGLYICTSYNLPQPSGDICYLITSAFRPGSANGPNLSLTTWAGGHPKGETGMIIAHASK